jgi:PAS domain S-box-containing protein
MNIPYFSFLHYFSFVVYTFLVFYILYKDRKTLLNVVCSIFIACFALWALGMTFVHNRETSKEAVNFWYNINAFGWLSFSFFFYWFVAVFTENHKLMQKKIFLFTLFLFPVILTFQKWSGGIFADYTLMPYGWTNVWDDSVWVYLFFGYYLSLMIISLYQLYKYYKKTNYIIKKNQAKIIFVTVMIILPLGSVSSVVLPSLHFYHLPPLSDVFGLVWIIGMVYSMAKYNFLDISPEKAAKNIIAAMSDAVLIINQAGMILNVNQATLNMLKYEENEIINQPIGLFFAEKNFQRKLISHSLSNKIFKNYNIFFRTKGNARNIPALFSNSILWNIDNSIAGIVCTVKDITDIKKTEKELSEKNKQMEENIKKIQISEQKNKKALKKLNEEKKKIEAEKNKTE